ncbi:hypothetical protein N6H18_00650 [Reichenbachiella agarivorans]|uniref:Signal transducing protein n=1 Tax=Reichenbachiella agarivorans TaxID=2979464 RepID=A0ABY6CPN6_9BACT|nr:hypothetical protein [Reichenbachiella agarivorans]UXP32484.1 hypothetical protein N6H18_00650 [Reichenbachiella agarivorans]
MIEVFITNIESQDQADKVEKSILSDHSDLKINTDLNETGLPFPCGHTIMRIEGNNFNSNEIISLLNKSGIKCQILEDKICA